MALHVTEPQTAHEPPPREPLPPGVLPGITDTDPPPLNPATIIENGRVWVDESKLPKAHTSHGSGAQSHR